MLDKEIYSYLNTLDNLKALLKAKQRGISTDGQKNWCYKDGSNQLHVGADQKYWNGSAWVYASNEFGPTTFYGNLALGANYLNYDGAADKGIVFASSNQLIIKNTDGIALGDAKQMVSIREDTGNGNTGNGAGIVFTGNDGVDTKRVFGGIKAYKENSTTGNYDASVYIQTRANGQAPANALRLDSSQNGYIKNKLMVGSLTETPEALLTVYGGYDEPSIALVSDRVGPVLTLGIAPSIDWYTDVPVIRAPGYSKSHLFIQHGTETPGIYYTWMEFSNNSVIIPNTLEIGDKDDLSPDAKLIAWSNNVDTLAIRSSPYVPTGLYMGITTVDSQPDCPVIRAKEYNGAHLHIQNTDGDTYIEFETIDDAKTVTIADKLVVDGDLQVGNDITLLGNFDADDKITASAINAKYVDSATHRLDIKSSYSTIARFSSYDVLNTLTVYGDLVVDSNLNVGGLTASQIVETDANKKLISVAKGTAYNANFGTGSNNVCRGNDSRLSDARVPINDDYYVQGSSSTRTKDAGTTDVNSYSQSGFYKATDAAPNLPDAFNGYGVIHTNHSSQSHAFQLASRWNTNKLYYRRQNSGTWEPWVELYHSGTTKIDVNDIQCDTFRLDQTPTSGTITPDKYITINCNGTNYKIPVKAV